MIQSSAVQGSWITLDSKNRDALSGNRNSNNKLNTSSDTMNSKSDRKKAPLVEKESKKEITKQPTKASLNTSKLIKDLWYREDVALAIKQASKEWGVPEYAIFILCMNENCANYWEAVGDSGCSIGAFQMNGCAGKGRRNVVHRDKKWKECAFDIYCSTDWVASQIKTTYKCKIEWNSILNPECLAKHQWAYPDLWYTKKTIKNLAYVKNYM